MEEARAIVDKHREAEEKALLEKNKEKESEEDANFISGSSYDGNTIPDSLLTDTFAENEKHNLRLKILKTLKTFLKEEYHLDDKLNDIFSKASKSKYGKEYAALNQALPRMKEIFNVLSSDIAIAVNEYVLNDDFKLKWVDVENLKTIKAEMLETFSNKVQP